MHKIAKKIIQKKIDKLLDEWEFEKRKKINPDECICYQQNKPCHNLKKLNCFFCYCPYYDLSVKEGACLINSKKGKYILSPDKKILDCSDCDFMHKKSNIKKFLMKLFYKIDNIL